MFENPRRGRKARKFTTNVPKFLDLKSSTEQIVAENWRWVPLTVITIYDRYYNSPQNTHLHQEFSGVPLPIVPALRTHISVYVFVKDQVQNDKEVTRFDRQSMIPWSETNKQQQQQQTNKQQSKLYPWVSTHI